MSHVNDVRWSLLDGWMVPLGGAIVAARKGTNQWVRALVGRGDSESATAFSHPRLEQLS